jgi:hypothetical protein
MSPSKRCTVSGDMPYFYADTVPQRQCPIFTGGNRAAVRQSQPFVRHSRSCTVGYGEFAGPNRFTPFRELLQSMLSLNAAYALSNMVAEA